LSTCDGLWFSRIAASSVRQAAKQRQTSKVETLIAIASPSDIARFQLSPINTDSELAYIQAAFPVQSSKLAISSIRATRRELINRLRAGPTILYLVCHGVERGKLCLFLEHDDATTSPLLADELAAEIRDLSQRPYLVILAACDSAGTGVHDTSPQAEPRRTFGLQLIESGVPAVIAMQGRMSIDTMRVFGLHLLEELSTNGAVDRAVAIARSQVRQEPDWWKPCLLLRRW
jgi:CHAT domain-containing protein